MRCFVIGNGPSLNKTPLDKLVGEVTFAVNRIHLIYPRTKWRPTHWVLMDRSKSLEHVHDTIIHLELGEDCYVREDFVADLKKVSGENSWPNLTVLPICEHIDAERHTATEWHKPICQFAGSVPAAIQLAVQQGYAEIYILGCDLGYGGNAVNHFDPKYVDIDTRKTQSAILANKTLTLAHQIAYRECKKRGVQIYNAGSGGDLNAYPRVKLEAVL